MVAQLTPTTDEDPSLLAPARLRGGMYLIDTPLTRFGERTLFAGRQASLKRDILIERIAAPASALAQATTRCEQMTRLSHVDIAQCLDVFQEDGALHVVMSAGKGQPLSFFDQISQRDAAMIGVHLCNALSHLRLRFPSEPLPLLDPSAIFVTEAHRARLIALASTMGAQNTACDTRFAPRAVHGDDAVIFSLAATLHHTLTGWDGTYDDGAPAISDMRAEIAPEFDRAIMRALAKEQADRWPDIASFRYALLRFE